MPFLLRFDEVTFGQKDCRGHLELLQAVDNAGRHTDSYWLGVTQVDAYRETWQYLEVRSILDASLTRAALRVVSCQQPG